MDPRTLASLEFEELKRLIQPHVRSPLGERTLRDLVPAGRDDAVARRKALADEAMRHHLEGGRLGPGRLDDPRPALDRCGPRGVVLEPMEIRRVVRAVGAAGAQRRELAAVEEQFPALWSLAGGIPDLEDLARRIEGKIDAEGRLEDSASPELASIRRRLSAIEARIQSALASILGESAHREHLQDDYVTIRNGRFVIPVRSSSRTAVAGIVHGSSSSGATVFVEPMATVDLNNESVGLRDDEAKEVNRILREWSDSIRERLPDIEQALRIVGELDLLGALAVFGVDYGCTIAGQPERAEGVSRIRLLGARHPVLEAGLRARNASAVPLTVEVEASGGVLVLSGPNAGGKTVALKTIGLLVLMNQAGIPVPAAEAAMPVFRQVKADIGDHQSILESLSTFSARLVRVAEMSSSLEIPALVLLDEVGAGTDPEEAGALAVAIVDHFRKRGAAVVTTTHHQALKTYAETAPRAVNASMEIDPETMRPTYELVSGISGRSGGIALAERVGLPRDLVDAARERLTSGHRQATRYLEQLEKLAGEREREIERLRNEREEARVQEERARHELEEQLERMRRTWSESLEEALREIDSARDELLAGIRDRTVALQVRAEARRKSATLREQLERLIESPAGDRAHAPGPAPGPAIAPGSRVRIEGLTALGETAIVESFDRRGRAEVVIRGKRMTVRAEDLALVEPPPAPRRGPRPVPSGVSLQTESKSDLPREINLIGSRVEEAVTRLDKFLDDAFLAGHRDVRIVHGHGTGRLRAAVRELLRGHPHVASFASADERSGGAGATEAVLGD